MVENILTIIRRNFISPLMISILILAATLMVLGEHRDAWFISVVIIINSVFACIQEVRAYLVLRKIELMSAPRARVFRGEDLVDVPYQELIIGGEIHLMVGDEIPADCEILTASSFEVNEAMLTGESIAVKKKPGDEILASSSVVAGEARAKVLAVGEQTKAGQISSKLKNYKPVLTPIQKKIQHAISFLTYLALALALLIFVDYKLAGESYVVIVKTITSAAVTVVPEGLLLASSMFFAYGSLKLVRAKVLAQKLSATEGMALLDVLATDKTGTLTSPKIMFEDLELISKDKKDFIEHILFTFSVSTGANSTSQSLYKQYQSSFEQPLDVKDSLAFSSSRKLSAIQIESDGFVLGAPENIKAFLFKVDAKIFEKIDQLASKGLRVLLLAKFKINKNGDLESTLDNIQNAGPSAIVCLKNELRENAAQTIDYLQTQGVSLRVISGDNPKTVAYVAAQAGINNPNKFITGEELSELSSAKFEKAVLKNTIFARVLPEQKEAIIKVFKRRGLYTGMVGDGVNDALAIKESDLGIAMHDGAPATRRVADLILLNNSFASLPGGMKIGNQIMQSIEFISILFFNKIIIGVTILLMTILMGVNYPFLPRHVTFMNFILVTLPTILITLFPFKSRQKINPKNFWKDTLLAILPISILSGITISMVYWAILNLRTFGGQSIFSEDISTVVVAAMAFFGALMTYLASVILNIGFTQRTKIGGLIYIFVVSLFTTISFSVRFIRDFFNFDLANIRNWLFVSFIVLIVAIMQIGLARYSQAQVSERSR
ncbi:MAG: HAD-IC family P-type ATPase [Candidatus Sacchiramonaceae bacterium]|nr:HAD-IC family P-type ATPase [Candidatus Saccharimonadaceae bacterium]